MTVARRKIDAYREFAHAYDHALGERFFAGLEPFIAPFLSSIPTGASHLDLACGTGIAIAAFRPRGFRSTGVDASMSMLSLARWRGATTVLGDLRALPFRGRFDLITCLYDSLNHLMTFDDLAESFREASVLMDSGSRFIFDVNQPEAYEWTWGCSDPFVESGPGFELVMNTTFSRRRGIGRAAVTGWADVSGKRVEIDEVHEQRAWDQRRVEKALRLAGLEAIGIVPFDPFDHEDDAGLTKWLFVVKKVR